MTTAASALGALTPEQEAAARALAARERIVSKAVDITLADGRVVGLRYGMAGVVALEQEFGGLRGVGEAFEHINAGGAVYTSILGLIAAGLTHHGITREQVLRDDLLDLARVEEYAVAALEAWSLAFPTADSSEVVDLGEGNREARRASRGRTGTTSPRSSSAAPKKRSGG